MSKLRIIVTGLIAQYPLGGVSWDYLQYVVGLKALGHEVYYIEDTGQWPFNPCESGTSKSCKFNVDYLANVMNRFGLRDKWAYCFPWENQRFGLSDNKRKEIIKNADLLLNVSGVLRRPWEYDQVKKLVYIDSDPVFTQVKLARGQKDFRQIVDAHDVHFSFGESFSKNVPETGHKWRPTRQPIVLPEWKNELQPRKELTTVLNWTSYKPVDFKGQTYGQKDVEFIKFLDLPSKIKPDVIELAINEGKTKRTPRDLLNYKGWQVVDPSKVCPDLDTYRTYIQTSKAEWSVAKNGYVVGQSGWFSCRSACYLASGRPVVVQDTGFTKILPVDKGILPFRNFEEAIIAIQEIDRNYEKHARAAREVAEEYFDSNRVLALLIEKAH